MSYADSMTKRRITISIDEDLLDALEGLGGTNLSATASDLLRVGVATTAHHRAMADWLDELEVTFGPPSGAELAAADRLLDAAEGLGTRAS